MNSEEHQDDPSGKRLSYDELLKSHDELQKCKEELTARNELLQQIIDTPSLGIAVYKAVRDNSGNITDFIHEFINKLTISTIGKDFTGELLSAHGSNAIEQLPRFIEAIETQQNVSYLNYAFFNDKWHWISFKNVPISEDRLVHYWEDITAQKEAELDLLARKEGQTQQATDRYHALFNSIDQAFCTIEVKFDEKDHPVDYKFLEISDSFEEQTGIKNAAGNWVRDLLPEQDEHWFTTYGGVALTGESIRTEFYSGSLGRWWSAYAYRIDDPSLRHVAVLFNDITAHKQAEHARHESERNYLKELEQQVALRTEELKALNKSLVKKNKELRQKNNDIASFSYAAGHYLKEPLRKIYTFIELILMKEQDHISETGREHFRKVQSSAHRLSLLTDDIMTFSTLNSVDERLTNVDLDETLAIVKNELKSHISSAEAIINAEPLPTIKGYSGPLQILFKQMLSNAIKFREGNNPVIHIKSDTVDGNDIKHPDVIKDVEYLQLVFSDNGIGFDPQYADKVFKMFNRLDSSDKYPGTGIGLSLCQKVAQLHNGFITVESTPGKGSAFFCYLQLHLKA